MTRSARRILYLAFIIIFLILAPILVLYSSGYRYDWIRKKLVKTSVFNISSEPRGAEVILNGLPSEKKTPAVISGLRPGDYRVVLKKEGYLPWQNSLTIRPGRASVLFDLVLFRDTSGTLVFEQPVLEQEWMEDADRLLVVTKTDSAYELLQINASDGSVLRLLTDQQMFSLVSAPKSESIIIARANGPKTSYQLVKTNAPDQKTELDYLSGSFSLFEWVDNTSLLAQEEDRLCLVSLSARDIDCPIKPAQQFFVTENQIYYTINDSQTTYFYRVQKDLTEPVLLARLPSAENYTLISDNFDTLFLTNTKTYDLFIIDPETNGVSTVQLKGAAKDGFWLKGWNQFFYYNDFEMWLYQPAEDRHKLLTRLSEPIGLARQIGNYPYVVFGQKNKHSAFELSDFSPVHTITQLTTNAGDWFALTKEKNIIYVEAGEKKRLWQRSLF